MSGLFSFFFSSYYVNLESIFCNVISQNRSPKHIILTAVFTGIAGAFVFVFYFVSIALFRSHDISTKDGYFFLILGIVGMIHGVGTGISLASFRLNVFFGVLAAIAVLLILYLLYSIAFLLPVGPQAELPFYSRAGLAGITLIYGFVWVLILIPPAITNGLTCFLISSRIRSDRPRNLPFPS